MEGQESKRRRSYINRYNISRVYTNKHKNKDECFLGVYMSGEKSAPTIFRTGDCSVIQEMYDDISSCLTEKRPFCYIPETCD